MHPHDLIPAATWVRNLTTASLLLAVAVACGQSADIDDTVAPAADSVLPTAADKQSYVDQLHALGVDKYLGIEPVSSTTVGDWEAYYYDVTAGATCLHGTPYIVSVRPATVPTSATVLYLQGGGACWDELTCTLGFAKKTADVPDGYHNGIFDRTNPENPVKDYNIVFASYCDGSVFSGDAKVDYGGQETWHWGIRNLSAAVTILRDRFADSTTLLVTGSSAGGFGTFMALGVVRAALPDRYIHLLNDSGPGIENPKLAETMGRGIRRQWQFEQFLPSDCVECDEQLLFLLDYALAHDPDLSVGMYSYLDDSVIGTLFVQFFSAYPAILRETTDRIHERFPDRFRRFFVDGAEHTILANKQFYQPFPQKGTVADWTRAFLSNDLSHWIDWR